jgi:phage gp36-like protein
MNLFSSIDSFKGTAHRWLFMYNHKRRHTSLSNLSPRNFHMKYAKSDLINNDYPTFQIDNYLSTKYPLPVNDQLTNANCYTKHCFWLNNTYITDEISLK